MGPMPIEVTPDELDQPSSRFTVAGNDIGQLDNEVGSQTSTAEGAAGNKNVSEGLGIFANGVSGALQALDSDACLLGGNIAKAKITYKVNDKDAFVLSDMDPTPTK